MVQSKHCKSSSVAHSCLEWANSRTGVSCLSVSAASLFAILAFRIISSDSQQTTAEPAISDQDREDLLSLIADTTSFPSGNSFHIVDPLPQAPLKEETFCNLKVLELFEGGIKLKAEVPSNTSGVTISCGVDLGQWLEKDLRQVLPEGHEELLTKLRPYFELKGSKAKAILRKKPLVIDEHEAEVLYTSVRNRIVSNFSRSFDADRDSSQEEFKFLEANLKTACLCLSYHCGYAFGYNPKKGEYPEAQRNLYSALVSGNIKDCLSIMMDMPTDQGGIKNRFYRTCFVMLTHAEANPDTQNLKEEIRTHENYRELYLLWLKEREDMIESGLNDLALAHPSKAPQSPEKMYPGEIAKIGKNTYYCVQAGDTVGEIAERYEKSPANLISMNKIKKGRITAGKAIRID